MALRSAAHRTRCRSAGQRRGCGAQGTAGDLRKNCGHDVLVENPRALHGGAGWLKCSGKETWSDTPERGVGSAHSTTTTENASERQTAAQSGGHIGDLRQVAVDTRHADQTSNGHPDAASPFLQVMELSDPDGTRVHRRTPPARRRSPGCTHRDSKSAPSTDPVRVPSGPGSGSLGLPSRVCRWPTVNCDHDHNRG